MTITQKYLIEKIINKRLKTDEFVRLVPVEQGYDQKCWNKFFGEIVPLKTLAKKLSCANVTVLPDGHQFDAILHFSDKDQFVEFTLAIDGHHRNLLLDHIKEFGFADPNAKIETNCKKKNSRQRKILKQNVGDLLSIDEFKSKLKDDLQKTIQNKYNKSKLADKEAWLVVVFFRLDYCGLTNEQIKEIVDQLILDNQKFTKHCFIGWHHHEQEEIFYVK